MAQDFLSAVGKIGNRHGLFGRLHHVDDKAQDFSADSLEIVHERLNRGAWGGGRRAAFWRFVVSAKGIAESAVAGWAGTG